MAESTPSRCKRVLKLCCYRFNNPKQVPKNHYKLVDTIGRIGFAIKALLYGFLGYLCLKSVFGDEQTVNESPQGVFIFLDSQSDGFSHVALITVFTGITVYSIWRFWEGLSGQGYDSNFSNKKNFFRYRLSPLASGLVYSLYALYIIFVITGPKPLPNASSRPTDATCFPLCWRDTSLGKAGLTLLAIAFTIAMITQLIQTFTKTFHAEMQTAFLDTNDEWRCLRKTVKLIFYTAGHVGFAGRSLYFGLVAYLFWRVLFGGVIFLDQTESTTGQAVTAVQTTIAGKVLVGILGFGLMIYGFYVFLCVFLRRFPTPPPIEDKLPSPLPEAEKPAPSGEDVALLILRPRGEVESQSTLPPEEDKLPSPPGEDALLILRPGGDVELQSILRPEGGDKVQSNDSATDSV